MDLVLLFVLYPMISMMYFNCVYVFFVLVLLSFVLFNVCHTGATDTGDIKG